MPDEEFNQEDCAYQTLVSDLVHIYEESSAPGIKHRLRHEASLTEHTAQALANAWVHACVYNPSIRDRIAACIMYLRAQNV